MTFSPDPSSNRTGGFALIVSLIMIALLTIMAVAFLSSSGTDRATGRAAANKAKADLASQAAINVAISRLVDNVMKYPDSATSWERVTQAGSSTAQYEGTTLYYRDQTPENVTPGTPSPLHALPLISGAQSVLIPPPPQTPSVREATLRSALPVLDATNSFDFNHARFAGDTQGTIGAPFGTTPRPEFRAQWIDLKDSDGNVTGRYAYWMEDESFKVNVNLMGKTPRGANTLGDSPSQIPLQGLLKQTLGAGFDPEAVANDIFANRAAFPNSLFFEFRALNHVTGQSDLAESAKFEATIHSGSSNLSRSGTKRVNLNKVVTASADPSVIRNQLDQIIKTITYHLPNFAQRFYRTGTDKNSLDVQNSGSSLHQTIYLNKIAANIRDYIDADSQPTIVKNDPPAYTVVVGSPPARSLPIGGSTGSNPIAAIGKENVPFLQEYMLRAKQLLFSSRLGTSANYKIEIDHYLEFWNMGTRDITLADLGPNPFLRVSNQFGWKASPNSGMPAGTDIPDGPSRDFSIPLSVFKSVSGNAPLVFRAGEATVLTTDPSTSPNPGPLPAGFGVDATRIYRPPPGVPADQFRIYQGVTYYKSNSELRLTSQMRPAANGSDYEMELILGNDNGLIESFGSLAVVAISVNVDDGTGPTGQDSQKFDATKYHYRGSSLKGNKAVSPNTPIKSELGDPRTNNEQLSLDYTSVAGEDQTAYKSTLTSSNVPGYATLTGLNYFNDVSSANNSAGRWPELADNIMDSAHAPAVVSNAPLKSIGELGYIFDPVRQLDVTGSVNFSRSGARTLRIGQPERFDPAFNATGLWDGNSNMSSREWTAWRLADIFATSDSVSLPGRININGVIRDRGFALKAALYKYIFQSGAESDPKLTGLPFDNDPTASTDKVNELIDQMQARLTNDSALYQGRFASTAGPFFERGEFSEMPIFNTGNNLATSVDTAIAYDRGREEISRRLMELITTRGNVFTVYAVGQSVAQAGSAAIRVTATSQQKIVFRIDPVWNAGVPSDPFPPISPTNARFSVPDKYAITILNSND